MKRFTAIILIAFCNLTLAQACTEGLWRLQEGFGDYLLASIDLQDGVGGEMTYEGASGNFFLRLTEDHRSEDGVSVLANYNLHDYTLNYQIQAGGVGLPMSITLNGSRTGVIYTFWNTSALDVTETSLAEGDITIVGRLMGAPMPFSTSGRDILGASQPGLVGAYECAGDDGLILRLEADTGQTSNPFYVLTFARVAE